MKTGLWRVTAAATLILAMGACEPTDWDLILASPAAVTGVSTAHAGADITIDFTLPPVPEIHAQEGFSIWFTVRPAAGGQETFIGSKTYGAAQALTAVSSGTL